MDEYQNHSAKKTLAIIFVIIAVILIGWGFYYSGKIKSGGEPPVTQEPPKEDGSELAQTINAKHQYKDGVHTFAGTLDLPTPCYTLDHKVTKDRAVSNKFMLEFTSMENADGACIQIIDPRPFKVTFDGPEKIELDVTHNAKKIKFNLFEVRGDENIDDFIINIKG